MSTYKTSIQTILDQYLGPKLSKGAAAEIAAVVDAAVSEAASTTDAKTEANVLKAVELLNKASVALGICAPATPTAAPAKTKAKPKAKAAKVAAAPKAKPARKRAPKKTGTKKVSAKAAFDQSLTKSVYWALVRHFKKEASSEDRGLIKANPEIAKEQKAGAQRRAEGMLAKTETKKTKTDAPVVSAAPKKTAKKKVIRKRANAKSNGVHAGTPAVSTESALNL